MRGSHFLEEMSVFTFPLQGRCKTRHVYSAIWVIVSDPRIVSKLVEKLRSRKITCFSEKQDAHLSFLSVSHF